jgi:transposase
MKQMYFIGVDVSKGKLDIAVINAQKEVLLEKVVANKLSTIKNFFDKLKRKLHVQADDMLICCENTGIYNRPLEQIANLSGLFLWEESALKIKKAASDLRGKSDKKDAMRIAEYALRYQDLKRKYEEPSNENQQLSSYLKSRDTIISQLTGLKNQLSEAKAMDIVRYKQLLEFYRPLIKAAQMQLKKIDQQITCVIENNESLKTNIQLLTSIPGIGKQNALQFILHTRNFTAFSSAKHLACYTGVVPFPNQSGIMSKRERISKLANQKLKKLIHLAAMASVRVNGELKDYFIRKVKEGKNKMLVLNAVRNKLIQRMFVVIKRQTPYKQEVYSIKKEINSLAC